MPNVWFITGSSRGVGRAIAEHALQNGDHVVATARNPQTLDPLVEKYGPDKVLALALDVASWEASTSAVEAAVAKFHRIDIVVNNAGYANTASVEDMDMADFRAQVDTNFFGVVHVTKAVVPVLRKQGAGHIFQVSSLGGRLASPGLTAYQSSKRAVGGFSTGLAQELAPLGVKITVLEPGGMRTDWAGSSMDVPPTSEPYRQTVGEFAKMLRNLSGNEITDPANVARIIQTLYESADPPVRMLVGSDAVEYWAQASKGQVESDERWKELSLSASAS